MRTVGSAGWVEHQPVLLRGRSLTLIQASLAPIGSLLALVCDPVALVRHKVTLGAIPVLTHHGRGSPCRQAGRTHQRALPPVATCAMGLPCPAVRPFGPDPQSRARATADADAQAASATGAGRLLSDGVAPQVRAGTQRERRASSRGRSRRRTRADS